MAQKVSLNHILVLTLVMTALLLSIAPVWPVRAGGGVVLRPPFNGTYRVTAYFDHDSPNYATGADNYIWIYNGERVASSYANKTGEPYPYDGHDGWDWSMGTGTDILAAAAGTVVVSEPDWQIAPCYGDTIVIDHGNGYYTQYSHLSNLLVNVADPVAAGQHIADSGDSVGPGCAPVGAHLHFGVRHGGYANTTYAVDPFGWRGNGRDPLFDYNGKESTCLWAGVPGDDISCADIIVEDDGAGWDQYGAWFESERGNGYRQHWTYSWDTPDYWARWIPPLRYRGYYQVHAFIPVENSTTTNAIYGVYYGYPVFVYVDQNNPNHFWASLGTHELASGDYAYLYDYTGEPRYQTRIAADAMKFTASIVYLPDVRNSGGWMSSIVIRNNKTSSAQVGINYYSASGVRVSYQTATVAGNGATTMTPYYGFSGSAAVVASQDVSVVVENEANNHTERTNYTGVLSDGGSGSLGWEQAGTTLYAPVIKRQRYGRSSTIHVANAGSQATTVYVYYYDDGGTARWGGSYALEPNGTVTLSPSGGGSGGCNASNTICSARIYTSNGQPLAGVVREYNDADGRAVTTHNLFNAGATWIYFPLVKYERYDMSTGLRIQNVGTAGATVTVNYYQKDGTWKCVRSQYTPRYAARTFYDSSCPGSDFAGNAVASASQPLVGMANEVSITEPQRKKAYSSFLSGTQTAYGPLVYHDFYQNGHTWDTGIAVQNLSTQNASVNLHFYHGNGAAAGSLWNQTINGRGSGVFFPPQSGFEGSVLITADRDIAAIVNVINYASSGDTHTMYNASNR
jgi:murein DD-endopeptidase MepM/ murein hydrolase activator NlpD